MKKILSIIYNFFKCQHIDSLYIHFEYTKTIDGDISAEPIALKCRICKEVLEEY